jgi:hypothetical protein
VPGAKITGVEPGGVWPKYATESGIVTCSSFTHQTEDIKIIVSKIGLESFPIYLCMYYSVAAFITKQKR